MRIQTIDVALEPSPAVAGAGSYFSRDALSGCDAVLWNPARLHDGLTKEGFELSVGASTDMFVATRHWRHEFDALLARGGTIVAFLPARATVRAHHFEDVIDLDLLEALDPVFAELQEVSSTQGESIAGGEPFHDFFSSTAGLWRPASRLAKVPGETILKSAQGDALAAYRTSGAGRVLLLPQLASPMDDAAQQRFLAALSLLIARLSDGAAVLNAAWFDHVHNDAQQQRLSVLADYRRQIEAIETKMRALEASEKQWAFSAQLVAGTGRGVARAVKEKLTLLTGNAQSDWLDESFVLVPRGSGVHLFKTLIHGELLDGPSIAAIDDNLARIREERGDGGGLTAVTVVDCRENIAPLAGRSTRFDPALDALCRDRGWSHMVGAALFLLDHEDAQALSAARLAEDTGDDLAGVYDQAERRLTTSPT